SLGGASTTNASNVYFGFTICSQEICRFANLILDAIKEMAVALVGKFLYSMKVESLITQICDTTAIAEFDLKFHLYVRRGLTMNTERSPPPAPPPIRANASVETSASNGSVATLASALALAKPKPSLRIQRLLGTAADEGLNQIVKEGQPICYIEQLGGKLPIKQEKSSGYSKKVVVRAPILFLAVLLRR
ncbi:hypothetical protein ACLOJK_031960, partial [Asimina triloba]